MLMVTSSDLTGVEVVLTVPSSDLVEVVRLEGEEEQARMWRLSTRLSSRRNKQKQSPSSSSSSNSNSNSSSSSKGSSCNNNESHPCLCTALALLAAGVKGTVVGFSPARKARVEARVEQPVALGK